LLRDNVRIYENPGADDSAHYQHRRIKQPKPAREMSVRGFDFRHVI